MFGLFNPTRRSLEAKLARVNADIDGYTRLQRHYAMQAYRLDAMAQPLKWGNLQNEANFYGRLKMQAQIKYDAIQEQLRTMPA